MKEIRLLMQELRNYPNNLFVVPEILEDTKHTPGLPTKHILNIVNLKKEVIGTIDLGGIDEVTL